MTNISVEGKTVKVGDDFRDLSPEEQNAVVEEIAQSMGVRGGPQIMPNVNQGIAESAGGIVDFINPFDQPHSLNPFPEGTGSAVSGIERGMDAIGVNRADAAPRGILEGAARGVGQAAGAAPAAGGAARVMQQAPGLLGAVSGEMNRGLNTARGAMSEAFAGGGAGAAEVGAEGAGLPEWAQTAAGVAGGVSAGALPFAVASTPTAIGASKLNSAVQSAMMPYTESGAQEVARNRMQELAGGTERARQLADQVGNGSEIGLTPAQRTQDPNLLGMEQEAARQNPELRERIARGLADAPRRVEAGAPGADGDVTSAQQFFNQRRAEARDRIQDAVDRATRGALRPEARRGEIENSDIVRGQLDNAFNAGKSQEQQFWEQIPREITVGTAQSKRRMADIVQETPGAQEPDIPNVARQFLEDGSNRAFRDFESVNEMHGLYSELRRVAREASSGQAPNANKARIANDLAESLLEDMGANAGQGEAGTAISNALAFSREFHDVFSQGTVGRLMRRTVNTDEQINPQLALERTVGRGGASGKVAADDIARASDNDLTDDAIEDFLISRYNRAAFGPNGEFNERPALNFVRDNSDLLDRSPHLRDTLKESVGTQSRATSAQDRGGRVLSDMNNPRKSGTAAFVDAPAESAVDDVFKAKRPSVEARKLSATARKDETGQALGGIKAAFSQHLIKQAKTGDGLSAQKMTDFLQSPERAAALAQVFDPTEMRRLSVMATELGKVDTARKAAPDIGGLSNRSPNRLIEIPARMIAARQGAQAGGGSGGSIQTAQIASTQTRKLLGLLQNDKAEQMLIDAVEDPELFRVLLVDPGSVRLEPEQVNRLAPYFTGAVAATSTEEAE